MSLAPLQPIDNAADSMQMSPDSVATVREFDPLQSRIVIKEKKGSGKFASVYVASYPVDDAVIDVAVKVPMSDHEYDAMWRLQDVPGVLRLIDTCTVDGKESGVLAYCKKGDLFEYLQANSLPVDACKFRIREIFTTLKLMHEKCIAHMDVKPENILIDDQDRLQLTDFGLSVIFDPANPTGTRASGTLFYVAPEVIRCKRGQAYNPIQADVWSAAVTAFVILVGAPPFQKPTVDCRYFELVARNKWQIFWAHHQYDMPDNLPKKLKDFLQFMLRIPAGERPSIDAILAHPFLA